jgi:hypothetical protein
MAAIFGLIAAIAAALITRSVMISNHRQAWINGLRDDLAAFFAAVDVIQFQMTAPSEQREAITLHEHNKARNDALLAYRKILMRLNMNELLHEHLEKSLESLLLTQSATVNHEDLSQAVTLARTILKREWEVTKYGPFTPTILRLKAWWRSSKPPGK